MAFFVLTVELSQDLLSRNDMIGLTTGSIRALPLIDEVRSSKALALLVHSQARMVCELKALEKVARQWWQHYITPQKVHTRALGKKA